MKEITVMGSPLLLRDGIVKLTEKQASARAHCLKPHLNEKGRQVKDCYEITAEVWFKIGEVIGYAGDIGGFNPEMAARVQADEKDAVIAELREKIEALEAQLVKANAKKEKQVSGAGDRGPAKTRNS